MLRAMLTDIVEAKVLDGYRLYLRFEDGVDGVIEVHDVSSPRPFEHSCSARPRAFGGDLRVCIDVRQKAAGLSHKPRQPCATICALQFAAQRRRPWRRGTGINLLRGAVKTAFSLGRTHSHFDGVFLVVVNQVNNFVVLLETINGYAGLAGSCFGPLNRDVVDRFPITVVHLERLPMRRKARYKPQFIHFEPQPEKGFHDQPVHPAG
jgi:hypothetical protein